MKIQLVIILVIVALGLGALGGMQLATPVQPISVHHVDTLKIAGDTVRLQPILYKTKTAHIPVPNDTTRDTVIIIRDVAPPPDDNCLSGYTAVADTAIDRLLVLNGVQIAFKDTIHIEYNMPPENFHTLITKPITIVHPDSVICKQNSRPFWIDAAVAGGASLLTFIINALTK